MAQIYDKLDESSDRYEVLDTLLSLTDGDGNYSDFVDLIKDFGICFGELGRLQNKVFANIGTNGYKDMLSFLLNEYIDENGNNLNIHHIIVGEDHSLLQLVSNYGYFEMLEQLLENTYDENKKITLDHIREDEDFVLTAYPRESIIKLLLPYYLKEMTVKGFNDLIPKRFHYIAENYQEKEPVKDNKDIKDIKDIKDNKIVKKEPVKDSMDYMLKKLSEMGYKVTLTPKSE